ncbi:MULTISPECIES: ATP-grasp domain-containing protein [Mammaliicoccus]|uniref:ATP-grasp domain-containing protein n=1 Tax=Mammaliicoccus fleurettii TaxID=150056 RepID=A0ABS5MMQ4_9STAP|nr:MULTISPECIES: ATP-grasp domain-containing protein [Mammaliicoccus]MBL0846741.1 ATP-grasp domain-containing protein [Mammaliicoccus fleurettii]MBS3672297.1 ATP-grasp domain-containing protein [Mammaliicoccus fleurettii]MBS3697203.1 ATP-grasp domain-containing protein [Mammaliicoccus fleurettii]MBW0765263.1 ATP-grasp domain-containing protein [Mammaliicoccus fleurettii]RIL47818.1 ATP-grasp domain-containing protein [Mammaliicoccus fleurettii]
MKNEYRKPLTLTLQDLYEDYIVYNSRPSYEDNPWLKAEEDQSNFLTAREMIISKMPMIVHEACLTNNVQDLLKLVNVEIPKNLYTFNDRESYEHLINQITNDNKKIFFQYIHGEQLCKGEDYAVYKPRFIDLNNKAKIAQWTSGKYLPKREIVERNEFDEKIKHWKLPLVIKPGDELPTAGGYGVMICYNEDDLNKAIARIKEASDTKSIIIEQFIEEVDNYCVQYVYSEKTGIQYIGAVKQLTDEYGFYNGNTNSTEVPQKVIDAGYEIMKNGVEYGYKGVSGFDLLIDKDGQVFAIDLNFRQNGSTSMLLLKDRMNDAYQKFLSYHSKGDNTHFIQTIKKYIVAGYLYPLSYYDGDYFGKDAVKSRFAGIWHAETESKALEQEQSFLEELSSTNK